MMQSALRSSRLVLGFVCLSLCSTTHAQFNSDFQTNVISGVTSNWAGDYVVGSNTVFDLLRIENGGALSNGTAYLGYEASASNNSAIVAGSGTTWISGDTLNVGYSSVGNSLSISNGGMVLAHQINVGYWSGSEGAVDIFGGSVAVSGIVVGQQLGSTGRFHASNASVTAPAFTFIKFGEMYLSNSTASVGFLGLVEGTLTAIGSTLTASGDLSIGDYQGTGTVWITGGQLVATNGTTYVSNLGSGQMTCSNSLVNLATLTVYAGGSHVGTLTVSGGSLFAREFVVAHAGIGCTGAVWICDGASVTATNDPSIVGESGIGTMTISNSAVRLAALTVGKHILVDTQGTLTVAGGTVMLTGTLTAGEQGHAGTPAAAKGSIWLIGGQLIATNAPSYIGLEGNGQMDVSNGVFLAQNVTVSGANSTLTLAGGSVLAGNMAIGTPDCDGTGTVTVTSGSLFVTNAAHDAVLEIQSGTMVVSGGTVVIDTLVITNACGRFVHSGGVLSVGMLILDPSLDADGDGMPNGWEPAHGFDPLTPHANVDSDGDGLTDLQEFLAGTDPTNSASAFRITSVAQEGNDVRVMWMTAPGKTNALQATSESVTNFTDIFTVTNTVGSTTNYLDVGAVTNWTTRFYRVRLVP
jgi:T5SS/PEP-CTERM-associated repeat protein